MSQRNALALCCALNRRESVSHNGVGMLFLMPLRWTALVARKSGPSTKPKSGRAYPLAARAMDGRRLRILPVESTHWISDLNFAAGQRHCLENPFVPESRVLIWLFHRRRVIGYEIIGLSLFFNHKK